MIHQSTDIMCLPKSLQLISEGYQLYDKAELAQIHSNLNRLKIRMYEFCMASHPEDNIVSCLYKKYRSAIMGEKKWINYSSKNRIIIKPIYY